MGVVAIVAQPGDRQLLAIDFHDRWSSTFFDHCSLDEAGRSSRKDLGWIGALGLPLLALALGFEG